MDPDECKMDVDCGSEPIEIKSNRREIIEEDEQKVHSRFRYFAVFFLN